MTLTRTLERLEHFGDSDADRALRPPVDGPGLPPTGPPPARPHGSWLRRTLVGLAVVVVLAVVVTWLVAFSPLLGASTVTVRGTSSLSVSEVRAAAGIASGTPLVRLDTAAVVRRVEALPQVASARVDVAYPSTVTVTVVERVPVLQLAGPTRLVDATGDAYLSPAAGSTPPPGLPLTHATGDDVAVAATVAAAIPLATRAAVVARIDVAPHAPDAPAEVSLALPDGRTVVWGDTARSAEKGALLAALFAPGAPGVPGDTIDLSSPDEVSTH